MFHIMGVMAFYIWKCCEYNRLSWAILCFNITQTLFDKFVFFFLVPLFSRIIQSIGLLLYG